jgi:hypothetical protein
MMMTNAELYESDVRSLIIDHLKAKDTKWKAIQKKEF